MSNIPTTNINTINQNNNGGISSGAKIGGMYNTNSNDKRIKLDEYNLNKRNSNNTSSSNKTNEDAMNSYASSKRSNNNSNTAQQTYMPNEEIFNEFMSTIGPYVVMSARERDYYQQMSGFVAQNGGNVREWAEDFLSTNAIANTLGISRESVYEIKPALINEALGEVENTKLTFSTAGSIINAFKQGERQQELAEYKSNYRNLKANGYTDDDPLVKEAISNINKASNDYEFHKDKSNRFFLTTWTQNAIEQIPYMAEGSIPKLTLSLLGGLLGGGAGATIGGALGQFLASSNYYDQFSGDAFWNMKNSGISTETALKYSTLDGITNALNESFLDVLTGQLAGGVGKLTGLSISLPSTAIMKKVVNNGSWTNLISNFLIYLGMDAGGEFVQESTQSLTSSAFLALAEWEEDKNYSQSVRDALGDALQEGLQGFLTGLFFGLPTSGLNIYADFKTATELKNEAIRTPSKEAFVKNDKNRAAVANFKTGDSDISAEMTDEVLTNLWNNTQNARKELRDNVRKELVSDLNLEDDMYLNKAKIYDGEIRNKDGEVISGRNKEVSRRDDGSLYFIIEKNEEKNTDSNTGHYTMKVANPNVVGTNDNAEFLVDASIPDVSDDSSTNVKEEYKELASSPEAIAIEQAGKIEFTINDENHTVTITNVEMQSDDKALKKDAVKELSSMYPDYDISWENMSETDREVYNEIDIENPRNTATETFGLNYVEREYDTEDKAYVRRWLGNYFSDDNAENDFMSLIVLGSAKRLGLTGKAFIERYLNAIQFDESGNNNVKGYTTVEEINGQIKATIYAGINADPTTFLHELHHTIMLIGDNMGRFCNVYQKVKNTERFKKFLRRNADIFKSTILCKRDSEGKIVKNEKGEYQIDESKLEGLFQNKDKWSVEEFEVEARLYEAYMRSGQTLNSEMKGFFNRVADVFRSVYRALRNGIGDVRLNDEIIEYYDSLYGFNSETETEADTSIHLNRISRLNQEEDDDVVIKKNILAEYSNPELFEQLEKNSHVYVFKGMDKNDETVKREYEDAKLLSVLNEKIYNLPENFVINGEIYNGKKPDAIVGNFFLEYKNIKSLEKNTLEKRIYKEGFVKGDILLGVIEEGLIVEGRENDKNALIEEVIRIIENKINAASLNCEGKILILYSDKDHFSAFKAIKKGTEKDDTSNYEPGLQEKAATPAQLNSQSKTQNSQEEKLIFSPISLSEVLDNAENTALKLKKDSKKSNVKKNHSSEILFQTEDEDKNSIETRIKEVINTKPSITITSENSLELSKDSKEAKKQVFDYCKSIKEKKVVSNDNKVEYQIVGKSYREILHHGISGIEDKDNPRIKYLSEEDKDYLLIATRVPEIIKNFKFLYEAKNEKGKRNVEYFEYYGCLVNCRGTDYFVRSTVVEYPDGMHYYDHIITKIEATEALSDNQSELLFYNFYKKDRRLSAKIQEEKEQKLEKSLTLKQVGDDEWTERAREIALNSTSIEDFFSKYRENVDFNGAELDDNNIRLLISDIFYDTRENVIDEDVDEYYYSEEDVEEDTVVDSFSLETEENVMPDDWLNDTEEEAVNSETDTETDVNTMPDDWLSDEEEETVQEVENSVFEVQKVVVDSELKESSLSNPKMIDKNTKPIEFAAIIAKDKKAAISFLQKLREINREFFYNEAEDSTSDEDREVRRTAYKDIADENIAPFIRNLVLETKNSKLGDLNELSDRAWHIVSGMINANPEFYMDLYARASNNYAWSSNINDNISKVKAELGLTDSEWNSLSFTKRRELALAVKDKELRDRILKGTAEQEEIEGYIKRAEERARMAKEEVDLLVKEREEELVNVRDENKKKEIARLKAEQELKAVQSLKNDIQNKLEIRIRAKEEALRKNGVNTTDTLIHKDLVRAKRALDVKERQLREAKEKQSRERVLGTHKNTISKLYEDIKKYQERIKELEAKNAITEEEAIERLINLTNAIANNKKEEALKNARENYRQKMDDYKAKRRVRSEMARMARSIMRKPSPGVALEEAKKIREIQAQLDPNFRREKMKNSEGKTFIVEDLKKLIKEDPNNAIFLTFSDDQIKRLTKQSLNEMNLATLENTYREVLLLRKAGLEKRQNEILQRRLNNQAILTELMRTISENKKYHVVSFETSLDKESKNKKLSSKLRDTWYKTLNMARKAQDLDNGQKGAFYNLLIRKKRYHQAKELEAKGARIDRVVSLGKELNVLDRLSNAITIEFPDGNRRFTYSELAYFLLSEKNEDNSDALSYGTLVSTDEKMLFRKEAENLLGTDEDAIKEHVRERIIELGDLRYSIVLSKAKELIADDKDMMQFIQAIEDDLNSDRFSLVVDLARKLYNIEVEKEDYYLPINRNDFLGQEPGESIKNDLLNTVKGTKASVEKGFINSRIKINPENQNAIQFDLFKVWMNAVTNQEHFLAMQEYVNQLNTLFVSGSRSSKELRSAIEATFGSEMMDSIDAHIKEIANPNAGELQVDPTKDMLKVARGSVYSAYLGWRASSVINQLITSPAAFLGKVSPTRLAVSMLKMIKDWKGTEEEVFSLSPFMKNRSFDINANEIKESANNAGLSKLKRNFNKVLDVGLQGLELADRFCVVAGWKAIFDQEIKRLGEATEENIQKAIAVADEYVQETQPQSDKTELAPLFKNKNAALNILLQFQTSLNVVWNNITYDVVKAFKNHDSRQALGVTFGYMTAGALLALAQGSLTGDDDDDKFWNNFFYSIVSQGVESVPIFSSFAKYGLGKVLNLDDIDSTLSINPFPAAEKAVKALGGAAESIYEKDWNVFVEKCLPNAWKAFLLHTGLPYSSFNELGKVLKGEEDLLSLLGYKP